MSTPPSAQLSESQRGGTRLAPAPSSAPKPGFLAGFTSLFRGAGILAAEPKSWPLALVPALLLVFLTTLAGLTAVYWVYPLVRGALPEGENVWTRVGGHLLAGLGASLAGLLGILLGAVITPPLAAPALERLIVLTEARLGVTPAPAAGFLQEMWSGLRSQALAAVFLLPVLTLLFVVDVLVPAAVVVTVPLKLLATGLGLAWNLFDYPLTLRGVRIRARFAVLKSHPAATFGFGTAFALLFWIPCLGILALPVGVAAATELLVRMRLHDPSLLLRNPEH